MLGAFLSHVQKKALFSNTDRLLLALSGGADSVVLAHLLSRGGYQFELAHCNFRLRNEDSEADERFCVELAEKLNVKIHVKSFDVEAQKTKTGASTQMAARELRYQWFNELFSERKFDYLLTAHHANDLVETMLLNLLRGTGIKGLKGIPEKKGRLIRPLLGFKKTDIETFAFTEGISYRIDKSNFDDKYSRNHIRLKVVPELKKINPQIEDTFLSNSDRFSQEAGIVEMYLQEKARQMVSGSDGFIHISRSHLQQEIFPETVLHSLVSGFGFNETQQRNILECLHSSSGTGKQFISQTHRLSIHKDSLVISAKVTAAREPISVGSLEELKTLPFIKVEEAHEFRKPSKEEIYLSAASLIFPLMFRPAETGDKFRPFGMKGFKLLSDFMKDEDLNRFERESCRVLVNGNGEIIWVIGLRSDDRYRVNEGESGLIKLTLIEQR